MAANIITQEDLAQFKIELLEELREIISHPAEKETKKNEVRWLKSHQVQRLLSISPGTLQNLRINGTIPFTKVGGVILYSQEDINNVMQQNMRNRIPNASK
ncbi:helix-turn-helix domain-containing protein [Fluviicola taffensis]|uniref:Helix-turn-helix domain-containing protein n=1 Tax=Fluviicola taffensis (strain DSM 16823 / NCIMB 13979 / RW262) TaxID=755732 RepID=F2IJB0_FLUTR|nr:helix-turn-helix domain-containing protein [Fluviicola taffensis]AEA44980.1 hypothetical protein Fluta_3001 [Fluviicola taffensis DSM 16823]